MKETMARCSVRVAFMVSVLCLLGCSKGPRLSDAPAQIANLTEQPAWWQTVDVSYVESSDISSKWERITKWKALIKEMTNSGESPIAQRRELAKYLYFFSRSPSVPLIKCRDLRIEMAGTYASLGEYQRAAKEYYELAREQSSVPVLHVLAVELERLGEIESAVKMYVYIKKNHKNDSFAVRLSEMGIASLQGATNDCRFEKPLWWTQYQSEPEWWPNVSVALPKFSCFSDSFSFIVHHVEKEKDERKIIKYWTMLSETHPLVFNERIILYLSTANSYSKIGDSHRAIINAWKVAEKYPFHPEAVTALKLIISEFERLGDFESSQTVQDLMKCYSGK